QLRNVASSKCFFFQAEGGIRDGHVTGVQTCALPIFFRQRHGRRGNGSSGGGVGEEPEGDQAAHHRGNLRPSVRDSRDPCSPPAEIGRASCREREVSGGVDGRTEEAVNGVSGGAEGGN